MAGSDLVVNLGLNATAFTRGLTSASAKLTAVGKGAGRTGLMRGSSGLNAGFASLNSTLVSTQKLVVGIGVAAAGLAGKAVQMAAHTEQMRISFEVLSGSAQVGNALFSEMEDLAQSTSLTIAETTQAAKQLMISFDPRNIKDLVITLGNISSGMDNVSLQDMAFLLQTSREEGKLLARDLRQFTTRGINMTGALADVFGLQGVDAREKVTEMVTAGEVGIQHVMQALQALGSNNMLARQAQTLTGAFNQAKDAVGLVVRDFGEIIAKGYNLTEFLQSIKDGAIAIREALKSNLPIIQMYMETVKALGTMFIEIFTDAAATLWILSGVSDITTTQILEGLVTIMAVAKHVFTNWRLWGTLAVFSVLLQIEKMVAATEHAFTVTIPAYLSWFADNWKNVFITAGLLALKMIINLGKNLGEAVFQIGEMIRTWGQHVWDPMFVSLDDGFDKIKREFGPDSLPDIAPRQATALETQLEAGIATTAGQIATSLDKDIEDALSLFRDFTPEEEGPGLGPPVVEDFAERGKKKVDSDKQKLGAMQRGSSEAIGAVIKAMGGRDKSPELVELKRQSMMMKSFPRQLARELHYKELHEQAPI